MLFSVFKLAISTPSWARSAKKQPQGITSGGFNWHPSVL